MNKDFLDSLSVKSPCGESWEEMTGSDQVRFCSHCAKDVHDLSAMTRAAAERLVKSSNGSLCVRYVKTPQGKLVTAPPRLTQIKRRARLATGALAASLAFSAFAYGQNAEQTVERQPSWTQTVKKLAQTGEARRDSSLISGTVVDFHGAVIPGAKVTLRDVNKQNARITQTNADGAYEFAGVEPNVYEIEIETIGFKSMVVTGIAVAANERLEQTAVMEAAESTVGLLMVADDPVAATQTEINTTVQPQELLELPANSRKFITMGLIASACPEEKPKPEKSKKTKKKKN